MTSSNLRLDVALARTQNECVKPQRLFSPQPLARDIHLARVNFSERAGAIEISLHLCNNKNDSIAQLFMMDVRRGVKKREHCTQRNCQCMNCCARTLPHHLSTGRAHEQFLISKTAPVRAKSYKNGAMRAAYVSSLHKECLLAGLLKRPPREGREHVLVRSNLCPLRACAPRFEHWQMCTKRMPLTTSSATTERNLRNEKSADNCACITP